MHVYMDFSIPCSQNRVRVSVSRLYETIAVHFRIYNGTVNHCSFFDVSITVVISSVDVIVVDYCYYYCMYAHAHVWVFRYTVTLVYTARLDRWPVSKSHLSTSEKK